MSNTSSSNNKRIAKNTFFLYVRSFAIMFIKIYTVRVVLLALGAENYGIYNVVGGIVVMFTFLNKVLATASQRFFAFELGRNNQERLKQVFNITQILYVLLIIIIVIGTESVGLWFLHNKAVIPLDRMYAANWVFQFSVLSFSITLFSTPYLAIIIAHERMNVYAYVGILDAVLLLLLALSLRFLSFTMDILIVYGLMKLFLSIIIHGIYIGYALKKYRETHFCFYWEPTLAKEILSYSGWNVFGSMAGIARSQGINMLLNVFFNPAVNAARGVAYQVHNAISHFAHSFYTAVRPQITKNYAKGDMSATLSLVFSSSKYNYYLLLFVAAPIMIFAAPILELWLDVVPEHTLMFTELVIIVTMIDSMSYPLMTLAQATGKVALYQSVVGSLILLNLPISYYFLKHGYPPEVTMVVSVCVSTLALFARFLILRHIVGFPIRKFAAKILLPITLPTVLCYGLVYLLSITLLPKSESTLFLIMKLVVSVLITICVIVFTGLTKKERNMLFNMVQSRFRKKH